VQSSDKCENHFDEIELVNISNQDRESIASFLLKIKECKPKVVAINMIFESFNYNRVDSLLANSFSALGNVILLNGQEGDIVLSSDNFFVKHVLDSGIVGIGYDENGIYHKLSYPVSNAMHWSFSFTTVARFDPKIGTQLLLNYPSNTFYDVELKKKIADYNPIDIDDYQSNYCKKYNGKIILMGELNSNTDNKVVIVDKNIDVPVTLIFANIIESILKDNLNKSKGQE
jgi:CHASE2 domain-containing sensor protein